MHDTLKFTMDEKFKQFTDQMAQIENVRLKVESLWNEYQGKMEQQKKSLGLLKEGVQKISDDRQRLEAVCNETLKQQRLELDKLNIVPEQQPLDLDKLNIVPKQSERKVDEGLAIWEEFLKEHQTYVQAGPFNELYS